MGKIPEVLAPAGSYDALVGAIMGGCDAIYLGTDIFNARIRAENFTLDKIEDAINLAHAHQKKVYITLNTELLDKELDTMLEYVTRLHQKGADAFIVADFGVMSLIKKHHPEIEVHASTQASVHNLDGANFLNDNLGVKRTVLARELDRKNIEYISKNARCETEIFVHGAHCMSVSGQCLMSYALGGRSGNRGECAQPCRLPYKIGTNSSYPLSLKDMSLAKNITDLLKVGTASLKIEGRMKGQEYVKGTSEIFRRLIDEKRNATDGEYKTLGGLFSRQGFTNGYFLGKINNDMLGVRTDEDKQHTSNIKSDEIVLKKVPLDIYCEAKIGKPFKLTINGIGESVIVEGAPVEKATNAPMTEDDIKKNLVKLGTTPFVAENVEIDLDNSAIVRVSEINRVRREAISLLLSKMSPSGGIEKEIPAYTPPAINKPQKIKIATFVSSAQIPENSDYFDIIFLPLENYQGVANGIIMPPVVFDSEWMEVEAQLTHAKEMGAKWALVSNIGQITRLKEYGFELIFDYRFNAFNRPCVEFLTNMGAKNLVMSPELTLAQLRPFEGYLVLAYGKLPLMTTHKCVLKNHACKTGCQGYMTDRQGASFFVRGIANHRSIIYNSVPIYMADKQEEISKYSHYFIFSDETKGQVREIIEDYKNKKAPRGAFRRIK